MNYENTIFMAFWKQELVQVANGSESLGYIRLTWSSYLKCALMVPIPGDPELAGLT